MINNLTTYKVLIPYLQGSLFRRIEEGTSTRKDSLNPLSTGKSVQTVDPSYIKGLL